MSDTPPRTDRRAIAAIALGLAAVLAAVLAARGPAIAEQAEYSWPPGELPASTPTRAWFTPLLLARRHAETIDARVPCGDAPTFAGAGRPTVVFATARHSRQRNGLAVVRSPDGLVTTLRVGSQRLARIVRSPTDVDCSIDIHFSEDTWAISRAERPTLTGTVASPPTVNGLFTGLDLRAGARLRIDIRPHAQDTRPSAWQTTLRIFTVLLVAAAMLVLIPSAAKRRTYGRLTRPRITVHDGLVALVLGVWWLLAPLHFDDGWVRARQMNSLVSGGYSNYYEHWGANLPLATWFEWLQHFVMAYTGSLGIHRLPFVALLGGTWIVCRYCLVRLLGRAPSRADAAWWSASVTFCVGAAAFGMMLRPEPAISLLVVGVLACCLRYAAAPTLGPIVLAVLLCGLAVTVHPGGVVSIAPLVVCIPQIWRDARRRDDFSMLGLTAALPIGLAWTMLLAFLDTDMSSRQTNVELIKAGGAGHALGVLDETRRYELLTGRGASVLRREFVVLLVLAVAALAVARLWRRRSLMERLPSASIALALVLLAFTPSKWIWHFGSLVGVAAVAIGFETGWLAGLRPSRWRLAAITAVVSALSLCATLDPNDWGPLDIGQLTWYDLAVPFVAATLGAAFVVLVLGLDGRLRRPELAVLPAVTAALLATTTLTMAADAAVSKGWTAPRQSISSLMGSDDCGVADDVRVPTPSSMRSLATVARDNIARRSANRDETWLLQPRPRINAWYRLPPEPIGVFVGQPRSRADEIVVAWARRRVGGLERLGSGVVRLPEPKDLLGPRDWTFVSDRAFPTRPHGADAVSISVRRPGGEPAPTRLTRPVSYRPARLAALLENDQIRSMVHPFLFEATPCASLPTLAYGLAESADLYVGWFWGPNVSIRSSPLGGAEDVFDTFSASVERLGRDDDQIVIHWSLTDPRDAIAWPIRRVLG